jgi:hypothetical protein
MKPGAHIGMRFEVLMMATMKMIVFWDIVLRSLIEVD